MNRSLFLPRLVYGRLGQTQTEPPVPSPPDYKAIAQDYLSQFDALGIGESEVRAQLNGIIAAIDKGNYLELNAILASNPFANAQTVIDYVKAHPEAASDNSTAYAIGGAAVGALLTFLGLKIFG